MNNELWNKNLKKKSNCRVISYSYYKARFCNIFCNTVQYYLQYCHFIVLHYNANISAILSFHCKCKYKAVIISYIICAFSVHFKIKHVIAMTEAKSEKHFNELKIIVCRLIFIFLNHKAWTRLFYLKKIKRVFRDP